MNRVLLLSASLASLMTFGNSMTVTAHVRDEAGNPAEGAIVKVWTDKDRYQGLARSPTYSYFEAVTDTNGMAVLTFPCHSQEFQCCAYGDNYYREDAGRIYVKAIMNYATWTVTLMEHKKDVHFVLRKKKHPIPMFASGIPLGFRLPAKRGVFGFDLKKRDWVSPYGKGEVADFSINYFEESMTNGLFSCTGAVIFAGLDGAYVMKKNKSKVFWSIHEADTNAVYVQYFPFFYIPPAHGTQKPQRHDVICEDEYLVLRTRTKTDALGNVRFANYSKIYAPFLVGGGFKFRESCFNPTPNDPNIEFDVMKNLFKKPYGALLP